jgi:UMF1 family MFS transporter
MLNKKTIKILSWTLYDFANTIFSMNIVSLYFALWITVDKGGKDIHYSIVLAISTAFMLISTPLLGIISDKYKRRMPFIAFFTLLCIISTALIGTFNRLITGLFFFILAYYGFQVSMVFYDALLPEVAGGKSKVGRISGYGVAMGYLGAILGLLMVKPFVAATGSRTSAFIPTAVLFFIFSLPLFIFVHDSEKVKIIWKDLPGDFLASVKKLLTTFREYKTYPGIFIFLFANFLYCDAINTLVNFAAIYANRAIGFTDKQTIFFLMFTTTSAIFGSFFWGFVNDKIGARNSLIYILIGWCVAFSLMIIAHTQWMFWIVSPIAGTCLGGTWVTGRTMVVKLSPPSKLGEFFGLYAFTEKFTAIFGPLLWGIIVDVLFKGFGTFRYRIAVSNLLIFIILGLLVVTKIEKV